MTCPATAPPGMTAAMPAPAPSTSGVQQTLVRAWDAFDRWDAVRLDTALAELDAAGGAAGIGPGAAPAPLSMAPSTQALAAGAHAALLRAQMAVRRQDAAQAIRRLAEADAALPCGVDPLLDAERGVAAGYVYCNAAQIDAAVQALNRSWLLVETSAAPLGPRVAMRCAWLLGVCQAALERHAQAEAWYLRATALAEAAGSAVWRAYAEGNRATVLLARGDAAQEDGQPDEARDCWRQALSVADALLALTDADVPGYVLDGTRLARAEAAVKLGETAAAEADLDRFEATASSADLRCVAGILRAQWLDARGDARAAAARMQDALSQAESPSMCRLLENGLGVAIEMAARHGDLATEAALLRRQRQVREDMQLAKAESRAQTASVVLETERALREATEARARALALGADNRALRRHAEALSAAAQQDSLTGLANRRRFDLDFTARHAAARRRGHGLPVAMLDIDHFKRVNDSCGHPAGDAVLRRLAAVLLRVCRHGDLVARLGGEEFAVVFARASLLQAEQACERLRAAIQAEDWDCLVPGLPVTVSIGLADAAAASLPEQGLAHADQLLYTAKNGGRNRVVAAGTTLEAPAGVHHAPIKPGP